MFELRVAPAPAAFAELGTVVEIREIAGMRQVELVSDNRESGGDANGLKRLYLAEAIHIDGVPLGVERLGTLPSRFTVPLIEAMAAMNDLHAGLAAVGADEGGDGAPKP